ncbi:MAG: hypothetical protein JWO46_2669 [Nocardioidaceae bacterium]|nr:hypothetical protein [Nocardioidaceae bacterium]
MMSMLSMTVLMVGLVVAVAVVGGLYAAIRVIGARQVDSDHPRSAPVDPARELSSRSVPEVAAASKPAVHER